MIFNFLMASLNQTHIQPLINGGHLGSQPQLPTRTTLDERSPLLINVQHDVQPTPIKQKASLLKRLFGGCFPFLFKDQSDNVSDGLSLPSCTRSRTTSSIPPTLSVNDVRSSISSTGSFTDVPPGVLNQFQENRASIRELFQEQVDDEKQNVEAWAISMAMRQMTEDEAQGRVCLVNEEQRQSLENQEAKNRTIFYTTEASLRKFLKAFFELPIQERTWRMAISREEGNAFFTINIFNLESRQNILRVDIGREQSFSHLGLRERNQVLVLCCKEIHARKDIVEKRVQTLGYNSLSEKWERERIEFREKLADIQRRLDDIGERLKAIEIELKKIGEKLEEIGTKIQALQVILAVDVVQQRKRDEEERKKKLQLPYS